MTTEPGEQPASGLSGNQDPGWIPGQSQQGPEGGGYWQGQAPPGVPPYGPPGYWPPYHHGYGEPGSTWAYGPPPPGWAGWPGPGGQNPGGGRRGRRALVAVGGVAALLVAGTVGGFIGNAIGSSGSAAGGFAGAAAPSRPGSGFGSGPSSGFGGGTPSGGFSQNPFGGSPSSGSSGATSSNGSGPADASAIASRVDPGLVDVNTTIDYGTARAAGTGMVLTPGGVVLTNNHVIDGATSISVTDVGNGKTYRAHVAGYDTSKDVAILKLSGAANLQTVTIARSNAAAGQKVVGIGNAGGTGGTPSYAGGTVTATGRSIDAADDLTGTSEHLAGMIETNADIQAGDSGGPLVNTSGQVIGMDTAGGSSVQFTSQQSNDGFAIPISTATGVGTEILDAQPATGVHLGATAFLGVEISERTSGGFGSGSTPASGSGVPIAGVVSGSPAARAGLAAGDVITSVDGHAAPSQTALQRVMVTDVTPGQSVTVGYTTSSGQQHSVTVVLASGPPD